MFEHSGLFSGIVRAGVSDAGADADGKCVLQIFGDGGERVKERGPGFASKLLTQGWAALPESVVSPQTVLNLQYYVFGVSRTRYRARGCAA